MDCLTGWGNKEMQPNYQFIYSRLKSKIPFTIYKFKIRSLSKYGPYKPSIQVKNESIK